MWKCKNPDCKREFPVPATMTEKIQAASWTALEKKVEKICCPFCHCIDLEKMKETTQQ